MDNNTIAALEQSILSDNAENINDFDSPSLSERHPVVYLTSLSFISLIGYAYLFFFPAVAILLAINIPNQIISAADYVDVLYIIAEISLASFSAGMSFLLYKMEPVKPAGRPLTPSEAPQLIKLIDDIQHEHGTAKIHAIKFTDKFKIEIIRTPDSGLPLFFSNTLLIGLPLMQSLSADQFRVCLLREFAHIQGRFTRITSWFYFLRQTWCQYRIAHETSWKLPHAIMRVFFSWYSPIYKYISQGASRKENLYADLYALEAVNKTKLIEMMSICGISQYYLENNFWPHLYSKAYKHKTPPYLPYASIEHNIQSRLDNEASQSWIDQEMNKKSPPSDEPGLRQRLISLDVKRILLPAPVMQSAANFYLADSLETITRQMDTVWQKTHQFEWQQKYKVGQQEQKVLAELEAQVVDESITDAKAWEYILLVKKYIDEQAQISLFKRLLTIDTNDARIRFDIGRTLLNHLDEGGILALESAMHQDHQYTVMACQLITKYCVATGNNKSAQAYRRKALAYQVEAA